MISFGVGRTIGLTNRPLVTLSPAKKTALLSPEPLLLRRRPIDLPVSQKFDEQILTEVRLTRLVILKFRKT